MIYYKIRSVECPECGSPKVFYKIHRFWGDTFMEGPKVDLLFAECNKCDYIWGAEIKVKEDSGNE